MEKNYFEVIYDEILKNEKISKLKTEKTSDDSFNIQKSSLIPASQLKTIPLDPLTLPTFSKKHQTTPESNLPSKPAVRLFRNV